MRPVYGIWRNCVCEQILTCRAEKFMVKLRKSIVCAWENESQKRTSILSAHLPRERCLCLPALNFLHSFRRRAVRSAFYTDFTFGMYHECAPCRPQEPVPGTRRRPGRTENRRPAENFSRMGDDWEKIGIRRGRTPFSVPGGGGTAKHSDEQGRRGDSVTCSKC